MAATIRDYIKECEIFPYSQEHYDLMKECAEIGVAAKFIENQEFMAEHAEILAAQTASFTEGYLVESVDQTTMDAVITTFEEKVGNIKAKIGNGLRRAWQAIVNFFRKIRTIWDDDSRRAAKIKDHLKKAKLSDEDMSKLASVAAQAENQSGFRAKANQPTLKEVKINYVSSDARSATMKNILAAGLAQNTAIAEVTGTGNVDTIGAICAKTIVKACKGVGSGKGRDIMGIQSIMNSAWKDAQKNGVPIYVKATDIDEMLKAMEDLKTTLDQLGKENGEQANDPNRSTTAENIQALNAVYTSITTSIGKTIDVYTKYRKFRSIILNGMEDIIKSSSDSSKGSGADSKAKAEEQADK